MLPTDQILTALGEAPPFLQRAAARVLEGTATDLEAELWADPCYLFTLMGMTPDPWQRRFLGSQAESIILMATRQGGKTWASASLALRTMILEGPALCICIAPSSRQSGEFVGKVKEFYQSIPVDANPPEVTASSALQLHLANGSRMIGLPDSEGKIRGYSAPRLLFFEEASRVPDDLFKFSYPMLATVKLPKIVALSTPFVFQGWFWEAWSKGPFFPEHPKGWEKYTVTADECPRITKEFLEIQRTKMTDEDFDQEYFCRFKDPEGAYFNSKEVAAMFSLGEQFLATGAGLR